MPVDPRILADVLKLVDRLAGDWDYDGVVTPETRFLADLGLESLDLVVLGALLQQEHGPLPFAEFLAELGTRPVEERDVTVLELVEFVSVHRSLPASRGAF
jgi:acyl carrier protein